MSEHEIIEAMELYGGSFVRQLAVLYRLGDPTNRRKLKVAFDHYFAQYEEMARLRAMESHGRKAE